jgi:L,D-peptidoglycan transpeptidase YkuD (ErfK/YbiS/YcfS/YnhG family)
MGKQRLRAAALFATAAVLASCSDAPRCPQALREATRLIVVTTDTMETAVAEIETFERQGREAPWRRRSQAQPAVVGRNGLGWGIEFRRHGEHGGPIKNEGDGRSPAGIYRIGVPFGFAPAPHKRYMELKRDEHVCVDELKSAHYGRIVARSEAGPETSGEEMAAIPVYKRGIVVDYPARAIEKSGSCIFVHIWEGEGIGTSGCVAAPEATVAALQDFADEGKTAIAILPAAARAKASICLP